MYLKLLIFTILLPLLGSALNILAIFPHHGRSHFIVLKVYLKELANRGHNVTVISHFPEEEPKNNYHDIHLEGAQEFINAMPFDNFYETLARGSILLHLIGIENCQRVLENKQVQNLISGETKFDVVIVEQFNSDCALGIAYKLKAPVVGISTHILMPWHFSRLGIPYNPSYEAFHFIGGGSKPSLAQKIGISILHVYYNLLYKFVLQRVEQNMLAEYFDDIPPLEELGKEMKFHLLCHHFTLTGSKLLPPKVIEVGGLSITEAKPLTGDLKKFMDEAHHGVVFISFGSLVNISTIPNYKFQALLEAMNEFPQRFILKWNDDVTSVDKNKLYVSKWLPQIDILGHPKIRAFWTHGGMGSVSEAIHYGIPLIVSPIFGDQPSNAAAVEESGLGVKLEVGDITKDNIVAVFKKVLDEKFHENVKELSKAWHDRPMSPMDTAIFWTEYAARHPNKNYTSPLANIPLYQYLLLDVILVLSILIIIPVIIFVTLCRLRSKRDNNVKLKRE